MAMTTCPECGKPVSDSAQTCPSCGYVLHPHDTNHARRAAFRSGSITGFIGGMGYIVFFAAGSLFNNPANDTTASNVGVTVTVKSGQNLLIGQVGLIAAVAVTALFLAGIILAKRLHKRPAIILASFTLVISVIGMLGVFYYFGMLALCGGWLFLWQPVLEVVGAYKMLSSALKYEA